MEQQRRYHAINISVPLCAQAGCTYNIIPLNTSLMASQLVADDTFLIPRNAQTALHKPQPAVQQEGQANTYSQEDTACKGSAVLTAHKAALAHLQSMFHKLQVGSTGEVSAPQ
jgi:hypothetical protein